MAPRASPRVPFLTAICEQPISPDRRNFCCIGARIVPLSVTSFSGHDPTRGGLYLFADTSELCSEPTQMNSERRPPEVWRDDSRRIVMRRDGARRCAAHDER